MAESQLRALAAEINKLADSFASSLQENKLPEASFAVDSPMSHKGITADMFMARQTLCDKLMDMWYLVQGPSESIYNYVHNVRRSSLYINKHFSEACRLYRTLPVSTFSITSISGLLYLLRAPLPTLKFRSVYLFHRTSSPGLFSTGLPYVSLTRLRMTLHEFGIRAGQRLSHDKPVCRHLYPQFWTSPALL